MTLKEKKPYSVGFHGHAVCCNCDPCVAKRQREFRKYAMKHPELSYLPLPEGNQTTWVNGHWRRPWGWENILAEYEQSVRKRRRVA